jgi:hypothetical protein
MVYFDYRQNRYVASTPTLIPDIRAHVANWRQFRRATGIWPVLSVATFLTRFLIMIAGVVAALWYGVARHGWTRGQYYLTSFAVLIPTLFFWFILERIAWNHDLRSKGVASDSDIWGVDQFPEK